MGESLKERIVELAEEIMADVQRGECFYEEEMLEDFIKILDELKEKSKLEFEKNKEEEEED